MMPTTKGTCFVRVTFGDGINKIERLKGKCEICNSRRSSIFQYNEESDLLRLDHGQII